MKNIHVLPTDKSSRLYLGNNGNFVFGMMQTSIQSRNDDFTNQNIYITNDEDINENDYIITQDGRLIQVSYLLSKELEGAAKVVLTTDQDLIKDGVQEIDDEFLEWFVKNPSCEFVEITTYGDYLSLHHSDSFHSVYKIIITKDLIQVNQNNPVLRGSTALIESYKVVISKEEPKQETLEEFSKRISNDESNKNISLDYQDGIFYGINVGAKWQAERMYSEEEAFNLCRDFAIFAQQKRPSYKKQLEWFEQHKKK